MIENRQPVRGLTLSEMAEQVGAVVQGCREIRDLELRVIIGEAATMGEALAQRVSNSEQELSEPFRMGECGWDGLDLREVTMPETSELQERPIDHPNQLKFWSD